MKIIEPRVSLVAYTQLPPLQEWHASDYSMVKSVAADPCSEMSRIIEVCGRTSWKSEDKMKEGSADGFCTRVVNIAKDESIAEHCSVTVRGVMDRYASHQLVRHRIAAYTQESTHYINYGKEKYGREIMVCRPLGIPWIETSSEECTTDFMIWKRGCEQAEQAYFQLLDRGVKHYHARFVLPGCLKTEVVATYNLRMWRTVIKQRITPNNTPEIVEFAKESAKILCRLCPEMFSTKDYPQIG